MSRALGVLQGNLGRVALLDMNAPLVTHAHRGCHVLLKTGGADSEFQVNGCNCPLTDTTAVLVNAWEPHAYEHRAHAPHTLILALYIEPDWLTAMDRSFAAAGHRNFFPRSCVSISKAISQRAQNLSFEMLNGAMQGSDDAEELVFDLMAEVITGFADRQNSVRKAGLAWMADFRIRKSIQLMNERLHLPLDSAALARESGLSRPHFFTRFRTVTGLTPGLFLNTLRMEEAARQLASGPAPLKDLAKSLGFDSQPNFTRFFRQQQGVAPSEFRRVAHRIGHLTA